jgi:hypothetical protein
MSLPEFFELSEANGILGGLGIGLGSNLFNMNGLISS